jgi:hypothetical protein
MGDEVLGRWEPLSDGVEQLRIEVHPLIDCRRFLGRVNAGPFWGRPSGSVIFSRVEGTGTYWLCTLFHWHRPAHILDAYPREDFGPLFQCSPQGLEIPAAPDPPPKPETWRDRPPLL